MPRGPDTVFIDVTPSSFLTFDQSPCFQKDMFGKLACLRDCSSLDAMNSFRKAPTLPEDEKTDVKGDVSVDGS